MTPGAFQLSISIANTHLKVLEWVQDLLGGNLVVDNRDYLGHKKCYYLRWRGGEGIQVLKLLRRYTKIKSKEIDCVKGLRWTFANARGNQLGRYNRLPQLEFNKRLMARARLAKMRGRKLC